MVAGVGYPAADIASPDTLVAGARGLHRLAESGDVRRAVPVRAGAGRKAAVFREAGPCRRLAC